MLTSSMAQNVLDFMHVLANFGKFMVTPRRVGAPFYRESWICSLYLFLVLEVVLLVASREWLLLIAFAFAFLPLILVRWRRPTNEILLVCDYRLSR